MTKFIITLSLVIVLILMLRGCREDYSKVIASQNKAIEKAQSEAIKQSHKEAQQKIENIQKQSNKDEDIDKLVEDLNNAFD